MQYVLTQEEYDALLKKASNSEEVVNNNEKLLCEIKDLKGSLKTANDRMREAENKYKELADWKSSAMVTLSKLRADRANKAREIEALKKKISELESPKGSDFDIDRMKVQAFFACM